MYLTIPGDALTGMLEMACYMFTVVTALASFVLTARA